MDQLTDPAERVAAALISIDRDLDHTNFYTALPANLVDALLGVAKVAAAQMADPDFCVCGRHGAPMVAALKNLTEYALPI